MSKKYNFVIVGAGFAGATCARLLSNKGYKCLIIEERPFVSGNCATEKVNGIDVHFFGAHILHTSNKEVWDFLNLYGSIMPWRFPIISWKDGESYALPYNMGLMQQIYKVAWPYEAEDKLKNDIFDAKPLVSVKDFALQYYGEKVYKSAIEGFYSKMLHADESEIPYQAMVESKTSFASRSLSYSNAFYDDKWQGIPENGYVELIESIIGDDIDILLSTNFLENKEKYIALGEYVIYTGEIDKFFNYCIGSLSWASSYFELDDATSKTTNLSGTPITNFHGATPQWHRMTEHKWLSPWKAGNEEYDSHTLVTYEYYKEWKPGEEAFYPIWTEKSVLLHKRYLQRLSMLYPNVLLCGRRPSYNFAHICEVIEQAMALCDRFPSIL